MKSCYTLFSSLLIIPELWSSINTKTGPHSSTLCWFQVITMPTCLFLERWCSTSATWRKAASRRHTDQSGMFGGEDTASEMWQNGKTTMSEDIGNVYVTQKSADLMKIGYATSESFASQMRFSKEGYNCFVFQVNYGKTFSHAFFTWMDISFSSNRL